MLAQSPGSDTCWGPTHTLPAFVRLNLETAIRTLVNRDHRTRAALGATESVSRPSAGCCVPGCIAWHQRALPRPIHRRDALFALTRILLSSQLPDLQLGPSFTLASLCTCRSTKVSDHRPSSQGMTMASHALVAAPQLGHDLVLVAVSALHALASSGIGFDRGEARKKRERAPRARKKGITPCSACEGKGKVKCRFWYVLRDRAATRPWSTRTAMLTARRTLVRR